MELIVPSKVVTYVPQWNGNKLLPENEQLICTLRLPDQSEREASNLSKTIAGDNEKDFRIDFKIDHRRLVTNGVSKITNLNVTTESGEPVKIETGRDLISQHDRRFGELVQELALALWSRSFLSEDDKKK